MEHHETTGKQGLKYFRLILTTWTAFRSKKPVTEKLLRRYLIHYTETIPSTSRPLAQLCLALPCIEGFSVIGMSDRLEFGSTCSWVCLVK